MLFNIEYLQIITFAQNRKRLIYLTFSSKNVQKCLIPAPKVRTDNREIAEFSYI